MWRMILTVGLGFIFIVAVLCLYGIFDLMLRRVCVRHIRRFCRRHKLEICRVRWQSGFEQSGGNLIKPKFALVQLDCLDDQKQRRLVLLSVWPFGVRKLLSNEIYPASYDSQWPQQRA